MHSRLLTFNVKYPPFCLLPNPLVKDVSRYEIGEYAPLAAHHPSVGIEIKGQPDAFRPGSIHL
jgi:hypothetical protein